MGSGARPFATSSNVRSASGVWPATTPIAPAIWERWQRCPRWQRQRETESEEANPCHQALTSPADRFMTIRGLISILSQQEDLNFLLTNRVPRAALTRFMGWFSKIEQPLIRDLSIACWRLFSELDLSEARKTSFKSLHDCFTRELRPGLRPPDPDPSIVASP